MREGGESMISLCYPRGAGLPFSRFASEVPKVIKLMVVVVFALLEVDVTLCNGCGI